MTEEWKPTDSQVLVDAWEEIKDCAESIQKDLACPDETISKMLRSVAETFDNTVEDLLDKAWGLEPDSRLSCQVLVGNDDLVIEIPRYTINQVSENH